KVCFQRASGVASLQILHRIVITDARKGRLNLFQLRDIAPNRLQVYAPPLQASLHDEGNQLFSHIHKIVEFCISNFRLDHPELGEMTASLGFFRTECWAERIDLE